MLRLRFLFLLVAGLFLLPSMGHAEGSTWFVYDLTRPAAIVPLDWSANLQGMERIILCESGGNPKAEATAIVGDVRYRVLGLMQLLIDRPMRRLIAKLGYTEEQMLEPGPNLHVAQQWAELTDRGVPFRKWECKP